MTSKLWMLFIIALLIASMASGDAICVISDQETILNNSATGYVPGVWTQTTHAEFLRGSAIGTEVLTASDSIVLGADYKDPGVYVLVGGTSRAFYRYNITANAWTAVTPIPVTPGDGASMVYDGSGHVLVLAGGSSRALYRFDVLSDSWALFSTAPAAIGSGSDMTWDGTYLYVLRGSTGTQIWRFDPGTGTWTTLTNTPWLVGAGASIVTKDGELYVTRGGNKVAFWKYTLSSGMRTDLSNSKGRVGVGSDLVVGPGGMLYCTYGNSGRQLESYSVSANAWSSLSSQPYTVSRGGGLAFDGSTRLYSTNGNWQSLFYSYNRTLNSWARMTNLPAAVTTGGCIVYVPAVRIGYSPSGTLTSATFDTGVVGTRYVQAFWDRTLPSSTTVTIEVRASDSLAGGVPASSWQALGSGNHGDMSGLTGRYVQWRVALTTADASVTPQLEEVRLYYYHA